MVSRGGRQCFPMPRLETQRRRTPSADEFSGKRDKITGGGVHGKRSGGIVPQFWGPDISGQSAPRTKKDPVACAKRDGVRKIPGTVLLSHSQIYSTIAAGALNCRVREGNVCFCSAISTGKKSNCNQMSLLERSASEV